MNRNESQNKVFGDLYGPAKPMSQGERTTNEQDRLFQRAQDKLFDELFTGSIEEHEEALKKIADAANDKTADMRAARDDACKTYSRISGAYSMSWKEAWRTARDELIAEAKNEYKRS